MVFDIGANVGDFTNLFLELGAEVISVDPQPSSVKALQKKFLDNDRVTIIDKGLASEEGNLIFFVSSKSHPTSTFSEKMKEKSRYNHRKWDKTIKVSVTTLDKLTANYGNPKFCKIDVEGFEPQVIQGLKKPIPFISFEFLGEFFENITSCVNYLVNLGSPRFNYCLNLSYAFGSRNWLPGPQFLRKINHLQGSSACGDVYVKF